MPKVGSFWLGLAGLFAAYVVLAGVVPPADDEIYYWCWARELQPSYFDHPPMVALLIRTSTDLFGDSITAIRLPACIASAVVLGVIGWLTRPRHLLVWAALMPVYTLGAVLVTPDTPLLLFWALYLAWLTAVHQRLTPTAADGTPAEPGRVPLWLWLIGGLVLGCSGLGKYTAVLAVPAGFVSFAMARGVPLRHWLPGYVLHGLIAGAVTLPVFLFNIEHDFAPMRYQWQHANANNHKVGIVTFLEFTGTQILLFGTLPLILLPWTWANFRTLSADPRLRASAALYAVPFTFFIVKSAGGPLEGNWALASFIGFWPVAAFWCERWAVTPGRQWFVRATFGFPVAAVALFAAHTLVHPLPICPPPLDRVTRQWVKLDIAARAAQLAKETGRPVYCPWYQWVALLRYHGADARQLDGITRPSNFTLRPDEPAGDAVYVFTEGPLPAHALPGYYVFPELLANFPQTVRGTTTNEFQFLRFFRETPTPKPGAESIAEHSQRLRAARGR